MKRLLLNTAAIVCVLMTVFACVKEMAVITVSQKDHVLGAEAARLEVSVTSTHEWTAVSDAKWMKVTTLPEKISISITGNSTNADRSATILIQSLETVEEIHITQEKRILESKADQIDITFEDQTFDISILSTIDYAASPDCDWIREVSSRADSKVFTFQATENTGSKKRIGTITFKHKSSTLSTVVTIIQDNDHSIILSEDHIEASAFGGPFDFKAVSKDSVYIVIPEGTDWISIPGDRQDADEDVMLIDIAENSSSESRSGIVKIVSEYNEIDLTVNQKGMSSDPYLVVLSAKNNTFSYEQKSITLDIRSNVSFDVKTPSWIIHEGEGKFLLERHYGFEKRTGTIELSSSEAGLQAEVHITQDVEVANYLIIKTFESNFTVPFIGGEQAYGLIDWGDGSEIDEYTAGKRHEYVTGNSHTVTLTLRENKSFTIERLSEGLSIDLSLF